MSVGPPTENRIAYYQKARSEIGTNISIEFDPSRQEVTIRLSDDRYSLSQSINLNDRKHRLDFELFIAQILVGSGEKK